MHFPPLSRLRTVPILSATLAALTLSTPLTAAFAQDAPGVSSIAKPMKVDVGAYLLFDTRSGEVLAQDNASQAWYPASITKLMTAYVVFQGYKSGRVRPSSPVTISAAALRQPPSKMGFKVGTVLTVDNALKMVMVKSANDVTYALAESVAGSMDAFTDEMNAWSRRLGMSRSYWNNPHGLPDDSQRTTARDMAILARALLREFPQHQDLYDITALELNGRLIRNHNHLLERYPGADGMKTGFICSSGFNVVATATRNGRRLGVVILGARTARERAEKAAELFTRAFRGEFGSSGWGFGSGGSGTTVERLALGPEAGNPPPNMRPKICGPGRRAPVGEEAVIEVSSGPTYDYDEDGRLVYRGGTGGAPVRQRVKVEYLSWLSPRSNAGSPVKVWLGGADAAMPTAFAARPADPTPTSPPAIAAAVPPPTPAPRPQVLDPQPTTASAPIISPAAIIGAAASALLPPAPGAIAPQRRAPEVEAAGRTLPPVAPPSTGGSSAAGVEASLKPADAAPLDLLGRQPARTTPDGAPTAATPGAASSPAPGSLVPPRPAAVTPQPLVRVDPRPAAPTAPVTQPRAPATAATVPSLRPIAPKPPVKPTVPGPAVATGQPKPLKPITAPIPAARPKPPQG